MDESKFVGSVFLELSKAFDLVSHDILLSKIAKYHAREPTLRWFKSYLNTIALKHAPFLDCYLTLSHCHKAFHNDQSRLGPALFSLYINDLPLCLPTSDVEIYADDTTLWTFDHSIYHIQNNLQDSLNNANSWLKLNKMVPNTKKTKNLFMATRQKLEHANNPTLDLYLSGSRIEEAKDEKLLGVKIDSTLAGTTTLNI